MNSYWDLIVPDIFFMIVLDGDLSGDDVAALCLTCRRLKYLCHSQNEVLYKRLLWKQYEEVSPDRHYWRYVRRATAKLGVFSFKEIDSEYDTDQIGLRDFTKHTHVKADGKLMGVVSELRDYYLSDEQNRDAVSRMARAKWKKIERISWDSVYIISEANELHRIVDLNFADTSCHALLPNIQSVAVHYRSESLLSTLALDIQGRIWVYGDNVVGHLGVDEPVELKTFRLLPDHIGVKQIALSAYNMAFIDANDRLWTCGDGTQGTLGYKLQDPGAELQITPKLVENFEGVKKISIGTVMVFLDSIGRVWACGSTGVHDPQPEDFTPRLIFEKEGIRDVQTCENTIAILDDDGCIIWLTIYDTGEIISLGEVLDVRDVLKFKLYSDVICFLN